MNNLITSPTTDCIACGSTGLPLLTNVQDPDGIISGDWSFIKCTNQDCNLVWLAPSPLETELWKAYTTYHTHTRVSSSQLEKFLTSFINRLTRLTLLPIWLSNGLWQETELMRYMTLKTYAPGKLLDVGCGGGRFMRRMRRLGWDVEGIDFDEKATSKITRRYGLKTHTGDLISCKLAEATYDAITMSHTIEHLFNPAKILAECLRLLKPGGRLVVITPNIESIAAKQFGRFWRGWEPPRHLHLFTVNTLKNFLQETGFKVQEIRSSSAGAAIVYRVSKINQLQETGLKGLLFRLGLIFWSYQCELAEFKMQSAEHHAGQNLLACAIKPTQS